MISTYVLSTSCVTHTQLYVNMMWKDVKRDFLLVDNVYIFVLNWSYEDFLRFNNAWLKQVFQLNDGIINTCRKL